MAEARERVMEVGDRAPDFVLPDLQNQPVEIYTVVRGGPIAILFPDANDPASALAGVEAFKARKPAFDALGAHRFVVHPGRPGDAVRQAADDSGVTVLVDRDGKLGPRLLQAANVSAPGLYVLDPNQRVLAIHTGAGQDWAALALEAMRPFADPSPPRVISSIAPVLIVPNVFSPETCRDLIDLWETGGQEEGRVREGRVAGGERSIDHGFKRRRDHIIKDTTLERRLAITLLPRLGAEVMKIHHTADWRFEALRVGCYDEADQGFFAAHRDNHNPSVKHRKFAVTLNLNTGEYEGGDLRFPEYGNDLYRPPAGAAIVFSCSMLHEVVPVTKGRRFTFLTFIVPSAPQAPAGNAGGKQRPAQRRSFRR